MGWDRKNEKGKCEDHYFFCFCFWFFFFAIFLRGGLSLLKRGGVLRRDEGKLTSDTQDYHVHSMGGIVFGKKKW